MLYIYVQIDVAVF